MQAPLAGSAAAVEEKDYDIKRLTEFWEITGEQDGKLCENNFRGIENQRLTARPVWACRRQVINFVDWCVQRLKDGVSEEVII